MFEYKKKKKKNQSHMWISLFRVRSYGFNLDKTNIFFYFIFFYCRLLYILKAFLFYLNYEFIALIYFSG